MQVIDLITDPQPTMWNATVDQIRRSDDPLRDNYLNINFKDFLSFTAVVNDNQIVCFSGLQYDPNKWGTKIARISSRMWIHPDYRFSGLTRFSGGERFLNSYYCVPKQLEIARAKQLSCVFVSREHNRVAFNEYLALLKINADCEFELLQKRYWVCGSVRNDGCLQYIGLHHLNTSCNEVWLNDMGEHQEF